MITLQNIVFPEQGLCTEQDLYFHLQDLASFRGSDNTLHMQAGASVGFGTYFNSLSIGKWHNNCTLKGLYLALQGQGHLELKVWHAIPDQSWEQLVSEVIEIQPGSPYRVDLSHYAQNASTGVIFFELRALGPAVFFGGQFQTDTLLENPPKLAISITTFKREQAVLNTVGRLQEFLQGAEYRDNIHIFMVDNGQSVDIASSEKLTYIANDNLGGAGGFARGLQEAEAAGFSHVLFTDDDAAFPIESLHRTYIYLSLAKDSRTAVAGAMINNTHKWAMWENGALFDRNCRPLGCGTDLREQDEVFALEKQSTNLSNPNLYGGWWFFAFPIVHARYHPYPFFVRGDDISFSIANDFAITTLNGVLSFQEDFSEKESPNTLYLDLRSHIAHHLSFPALEIGGTEVAKIAVKFLLKHLVKFHYETMEALLLSWEDVMQGPQFFLDNKDMSARRATLKTIVKNEIWQPLPEGNTPVATNPARRLGRFWFNYYRFSLNGHLLPMPAWISRKVVAPLSERSNLHMIWGSDEITYLNTDRTKSYTTRRDRLRGLKLLGRTIRIFFKFRARYPALCKEYRDSYPQIASKDYWREVYKDS